jgi:N-formylglutamate deformylase
VILHIPHASATIPAQFRDQFILNNKELASEHLRLVDAYTGELFESTGAKVICFPYSRLLVDVERFPDDDQEPMSQVGMGMLYTQTSTGMPLRRSLEQSEKTKLNQLYDLHHLALTQSVERELAREGTSLIIDCHSFPSIPLPCDSSQVQPRPDICIGTDEFHTPRQLLQKVIKGFERHNFSLGINEPYAGALVPMNYYGKDARVLSIMIEINRSLYMNEATGAKSPAFEELKNALNRVLNVLMKSNQGEK